MPSTRPDFALCGATLVTIFCLVSASARLRGFYPPEFEEFVRSQEAAVLELADYATSLHLQRTRLVRNCTCAKHQCSNAFLDVPCVHHLGTPPICGVDGRRADEEDVAFRTPSGTDPLKLTQSLKENICVYQHMRDLVRNYEQDSFGWTYIGALDGFFVSHPAQARDRSVDGGDEAFGQCRPYDPRLRPWYIGASTGPKDIVLVVDTSGSMNEIVGSGSETKWGLTARAVETILDTFSLSDFVNVVTFADDAAPLWKRSELGRGLNENLQVLKERMAAVLPFGSTNFTAGFEVAFRLLRDACDDAESCSRCQKAILFLTDGEDMTGPADQSIRPSLMAEIIAGYQIELEEKTGSRAAIFTYSISELADDRIPRQIACANDGAWAYVDPSTNMLDALNSYYRYFATGRDRSPIWTEPYEDADDLGILTTVAVPFFARGTDAVPDVLLGVVGHDVGLHELQRNGVTPEWALNGLINRSAACVPSETTPCELQVYRSASDPRAECTDSYLDGAELCHVYGDVAYKSFSDFEDWNAAAETCEEDGGQLVSIADVEELEFVSRLATIDGSWVGGRITRSSRLRWISGVLQDVDEMSGFWGVREPRMIDNERLCIAVDTRGVVANLFAAPCSESRPFICRYASAKRCKGDVASAPERGYFNVPPVESCHPNEILDASRPIEEASALLTNDVMCPWDDPLPSHMVRCCESSSSDGVANEWWFWTVVGVVLILAAIVVALVYKWVGKKRPPTLISGKCKPAVGE